MPAGIILNLIISLLVPTLAGYAICLILFKKLPFNSLVSLSISFGVGIGMITHWMLLLSMIGLTYSRANICFPLTAVSLISIFYIKKNRMYKNIDRNDLIADKRIDGFTSGFLNNFSLKTIIGIAVFVYITFQIYFVFWRSLNIPICSWDALYVIASKAKCLFYEGSIEPLKNYNLSSYPLHVPLSLTWVALNLGVWDEQLIKIIFPVVFLCYLIIQYDFLCRHTNKWWALIGTGLFVSANFPIYHATIAYRDFFLMYYNISVIILLLTGYETERDQFFILAGLFAGFATFTKLEALGYFFVNSLAFLFLLFKMKRCGLKEKMVKFLKFIVPGIGIFLFYYLYKHIHNIGQGQGRFLFDFNWQNLARIKVILWRFLEDFFLSGNWNILWFLLAVSLFVRRASITKNFQTKILLLLLLLYLGFYFIIALFTANFISIAGSHSYTVLSRLILHFFPLCPLLIVFLNYSNE